MSTAYARVVSRDVSWNILALVMRVEKAEVKLQLEELIRQMKTFQAELIPLVSQLQELDSKIEPLLEETVAFRETLVPLWDDIYNLCDQASCPGTCAICRDGEFIDDCQRRRR